MGQVWSRHRLHYIYDFVFVIRPPSPVLKRTPCYVFPNEINLLGIVIGEISRTSSYFKSDKLEKWRKQAVTAVISAPSRYSIFHNTFEISPQVRLCRGEKPDYQSRIYIFVMSKVNCVPILAHTARTSHVPISNLTHLLPPPIQLIRTIYFSTALVPSSHNCHNRNANYVKIRQTFLGGLLSWRSVTAALTSLLTKLAKLCKLGLKWWRSASGGRVSNWSTWQLSLLMECLYFRNVWTFSDGAAIRFGNQLNH